MKIVCVTKLVEYKQALRLKPVCIWSTEASRIKSAESKRLRVCVNYRAIQLHPQHRSTASKSKGVLCAVLYYIILYYVREGI